jgi:hypothetical protein
VKVNAYFYRVGRRAEVCSGFWGYYSKYPDSGYFDGLAFIAKNKATRKWLK